MTLKKRFFQNKLLGNSLYLYLAHFADYILLIIFLPFIAQTLGAEEFGKISLAQTFGIFIILFFEFGSSLALTREVSVKKQNRLELDMLIGKVFLSKLLLFPIALIIAFLCVRLVPVFNENPSHIFIVSIGAFFQGLSPFWYFQGIEKMKKIALSKFFFRLLSFIAIFFFINSNEQGWLVLLTFSLSSIFICLYLIFQLSKEIDSLSLPLISQAVNVYRISKSSFLITIVPVFVQSVTVLFLSSAIGPLQLGFYYGANRIYRAANSLFGPIGQAFFPNIARIHSFNEQKAFLLTKNFFFGLTLFGIFMFLIIFFFSEQVVLIFLGKEYLGSSSILILFGVALPLTAVSHVLGRQWLIVKKKDIEYVKCIIFSSLVFFVCFFVCLDRFGAMSFPIALIAYEISSILFLVFFFILKFKIS